MFPVKPTVDAHPANSSHFLLTPFQSLQGLPACLIARFIAPMIHHGVGSVWRDSSRPHHSCQPRITQIENAYSFPRSPHHHTPHFPHPCRAERYNVNTRRPVSTRQEGRDLGQTVTVNHTTIKRVNHHLRCRVEDDAIHREVKKVIARIRVNIKRSRRNRLVHPHRWGRSVDRKFSNGNQFE